MPQAAHHNLTTSKKHSLPLLVGHLHLALTADKNSKTFFFGYNTGQSLYEANLTSHKTIPYLSHLAIMHLAASVFAFFFAVAFAWPLEAEKRAPCQKRQAPDTSHGITPYMSGIQNASFTWNDNCGSTVACGPSAAGVQGIGAAALNTQAYMAGKSILNGVGAGCGQCWHLQPLTDVYPSNGKNVGTPIVVKINDQCPDAGYCQQSDQAPLNQCNKPLHFDLCAATGAAQAFFGEIPPGVLLGVAKYDPTCAGLEDGHFGASQGTLV